MSKLMQQQVATSRPKRLGELLIHAKAIDSSQLQFALQEQTRLNNSSKRKFKLGEILLFLKLIELPRLHTTLQQQRPRSRDDEQKLSNLRSINERPLDQWLKKVTR